MNAIILAVLVMLILAMLRVHVVLSLFVGALAGQMLVRLSVDGETITGEERLLQGLRERIRDVRMGPDGALYLVTDNNAGRVLKVTPAK